MDPSGQLTSKSGPTTGGGNASSKSMKPEKSKCDACAPLKSGLYKVHFKRGKPSCAGRYRSGAKTGKWKYDLRNGWLKASGKYVNGKMTGEWKW